MKKPQLSQPVIERAARLRIIPVEPDDRLQDCGSCRNQPNCLAGETEFVTADGTKTLANCAGTKQLVLTRGGKWVEADIRSFGVQRLYKITLSRAKSKKTIYATADHGWFVHPHRHSRTVKKMTTLELRPGKTTMHYAFGRGSLKKGVSGAKPSPFGIAHGFVYGDGSTRHDKSFRPHKANNNVSLFGEKDAPLRPYFQLCTVHPCNGGEVFSEIPNHYRELPSLRENTSYLLGWLMGYLAADGSVTKNGTPRITSVTKKNIEFYRDVCHLVGIGTYSIQRQDRISNLTHKPSTIYVMCLMRDSLTPDFFLLEEHKHRFTAGDKDLTPRSWRVESVEETDRVEEVYCASVPEHHAFALDGNILTSNCWLPGIKEEHIITNLLVCRIKRGIEVNRAAKLFLQMVRPALKGFAKKAVRGTNIPVDVALADLESQTIEYLQHYYVMGEIAYPMHYLFGQPNGVIRHFSNNYARKTRRYEETHVLDSGQSDDHGGTGLSAWDSMHDVTAEPADTESTRAAREVLDDGVTLTLPEYRVLKFCLSNAVEAKRPLNGLHVYLARTMGVVRARVTKVYADATKKLVSEVRSTM